MSTFLIWHEGVALRIYRAVALGETDNDALDITSVAVEVSLHDSDYTPDVGHDEQADLSDELTGAGYDRQTLTNVTYADTSDLGEIEAVLDVDDSVWLPGTYSGGARTAVWSVMSTGEVIAHAGIVTDDGTTDIDPSTAGLRIEWGPVSLDPVESPVGGYGAATPSEALGWSPAHGYTSTSTAAGVTTWETFTSTTARALVTFAHAGLRSGWSQQLVAVDSVTNPNLSTYQRGSHDLIHVLKFPIILRDTTDTLAQVANGLRDDHFLAFGEILADNGYDTAPYASGLPFSCLSPAWEANGNWYPWYLGNDPAAFADAFDRVIAKIIEGGGLTAANFAVDYCLNTKGSTTRDKVLTAWPTSATQASLDVYDIEKVGDGGNPPKNIYSGYPDNKAQWWDRNWQLGQLGQSDTSTDSLVGLRWVLEQCKQKDLYFAVSELGPLIGTARVGGDNWHMIRDWHAFLQDEACPSGRLVWAAYSDYLAGDEDGRIRGGALPDCNAKLLELF